MIEYFSSSVASLYDGGWRAIDREQLKKEYDLTEEEVNSITDELKTIEQQEG